MEPIDRTYRVADGSELPMRVWRPNKVRAALVYLHGIVEHSGWFEASSRRLAETGVAVYQLDRRGCGRDASHPRGDIDRAETWLSDAHAAAELARQETGRDQVHLLGVSWGGIAALAAAADRPDLFRSLLLSAPGLYVQGGLFLGSLGRTLWGLFRHGRAARLALPEDDGLPFAASEERRRYADADPLRLREMTVRFFMETWRLTQMAIRGAPRVRAPVLLALAGRDAIVKNGPTRALVESMAVRRRVVEYPGALHTLEFETDPSRYFEDLAAWVGETEGGG